VNDNIPEADGELDVLLNKALAAALQMVKREFDADYDNRFQFWIESNDWRFAAEEVEEWAAYKAKFETETWPRLRAAVEAQYRLQVGSDA
jgi:hypothetical protein